MSSQPDTMFDHDDGLVHGHGWASSTPPGGRPGLCPGSVTHDVHSHVTRSMHSHDAAMRLQASILK